MAQDIVSSLFGLSPWEVQQQRNTAIDQAAQTYAKQDPFQRATATMYQAGAGLGRIGAGMLGMQDPAVAEAEQRQMAIQGLDLSDPEAIIERARMIKDPKLQYGLVQLAEQRRDTMTKRKLTEAQTAKALRDPSYREYEYERMMEVINDPDATDEMKAAAQKRIDALNTKASTGGKGAGASVRVVGEDGNVYEMLKDGTGKSVAVLKPDGTPLRAAEASPTLKAELAQSAAGGKAVGEAGGAAQQTTVDAQYTFNTANRQIDELLAHPGFASAVGVGLPKADKMVGTKEAGFAARYRQLKGGAFLQAFAMLRGGGQITEVEGAKATDAMNRMDTSTSEEEFRAAAEDFRQAMKDGIAKLKEKGSLKYVPPSGTKEKYTFSAKDYADSARSREEVRARYKSGQFTKEEAKAILQQMDKDGVK